MMRALTSTAASLEDRALLKKCIVAEKFKLSAIAFFLPQSMNQLKQQSKKSSCLKVVNLLLLNASLAASNRILRHLAKHQVLANQTNQIPIINSM
jgi:uncharacterized membrane protein